MDAKAEARDFLITRRNRLTPERAGLPFVGGNRRVPGLRREEVAMLAGVSVEYYVRLERGNLAGVSEQVLDAVSSALQLDEAERAHLYDLARNASTRSRTSAPRRVLRPQVQWLLDQMTGSAAYVRNGRLDIIGTNPLGRALYAPVFEAAGGNTSRFIFLCEEQAREFFIDYDQISVNSAAILRSLAGENPHDPALTRLVGELSTRSERFRQLWARHDVRLHRSGVKRFRHPLVGELEVSYESMDLAADPGLRLNAYAAEPGTESAERLALLASWAASPPVDVEA
ncbi:helix-turn-helix transcriptional regulator [Aestuariimicrobium soli]|uniref:helix-turn-helix transcriptional regulator n=1 Tax=Aestuariimicrobium soli TaxID=2035834 RepID=UPI003EBC9EF6